MLGKRITFKQVKWSKSLNEFFHIKEKVWFDTVQGMNFIELWSFLQKNQNWFLFQSLIHDFTFNKTIFEILLKLSFFRVKSAISLGALLGLTPYIKYEVDDPVGIRQFAKFQDKQTYNYIVIGGGTTGSVIASRLSENPYNRVLLLEAGGDGTLLSDIGK